MAKKASLAMRDAAALVGIGTTEFTRNSGTTVLDMAAHACRSAILDAGLTAADIDGIICYQENDSVSVLEVAGALGLKQMNWYNDVQQGGPGTTSTVAEAAMAVASGAASAVLVYRAMNGRSGVRMGRFGTEGGAAGWQQWTMPVGFAAPAQIFSLFAQRHMDLYGTTSEQLGHVSVTQREHAQLNPAALFYGKPITLDDHQNSRMIASPYRLLDCCLETDGAAAVLVTSAERAKDLAHDPVYIGGFSYGCGPNASLPFTNWPDHSVMFPKYIAEKAYQMSGLGPKDVDFAEIYDAFTFGVICQLEDLGFVEKGMGGPFVEEGNIKLGGTLPVNLNGGLMSEAYVHGLNNMVEAVRQLRREAGERQVKDANVGLVTGFGGAIGSVMMLHR